jgi:hypothetical protein
VRICKKHKETANDQILQKLLQESLRLSEKIVTETLSRALNVKILQKLAACSHFFGR